MAWLLPLIHIFLYYLIARAPVSSGWGIEGHVMVCKIAQEHFTNSTMNAVLELAGGELAPLCPWADDVRKQYRWSRTLHFADSAGDCTFQYSRDCHNSKGEINMCAVGAINNYTSQLQKRKDSSNNYNLTESLLFLSHFVGDIHQPLHAGSELDLGGNTIKVQWYGKNTNLHKVWDEDIVKTAKQKFYDDDIDTMVESIQINNRDIWSDEIDQWMNCSAKNFTCGSIYASESARLACDYAYKDAKQGSALGDEYFISRLPVVEKRIAQGGIRLAEILNKIFDDDSGQKDQKLLKERRIGGVYQA
ncbi:hypothetical protein KFK09_017469 [Dendrobium nobile]|uniref:Aspergillus nuclease S1 n=1 Tax=Dendrobium nobile TaxID=94219 RepID=A0A8T3B125_DENNO|nr:hypothetical protein KFK09_017469 [Dendrobium nobile]